ncbi:MAG: ATP-dependent DNA helicase RecG [Acidobacteriota bacterium]
MTWRFNSFIILTVPLKQDTPVQYIKGVGPRRAEMLAKADIHTVEDLLRYKPFRYEDRTRFKSIGALRADQEAVIQAEVRVTGNYTTPRRGMRIFEMIVSDGSGSLSVKFFNQPYLERVFQRGRSIILFGAPRLDDYTHDLSLINPEYEMLDSSADAAVHTGRIVPVYRRIGQLHTRALRQIIFHLLSRLEPGGLPETLPGALLTKNGFPSLLEALREIHFPVFPPAKDQEWYLEILSTNRTPSHQRLIFEEFFFFQIGLQLIKKRRQLIPKERRIQITDRVREVIKSILPFHPTGAQKRVLREIADDLCGPKVMSRLLQGDVGSGKTIVALQAMIIVIENGFQAVLMAPTEILAEQHFRTLSRYLSQTGYRVAFLSGKIKGKQRKTILAEIESGEANLIIGTHAVFQKKVRFADLALVIIDEQHRFGVRQRSQLMEKGGRPDTLVMTATPIPRSLALTLYGDLDLSLIDEMPPGRRPVTTLVEREKNRTRVYQALRRELQQGRQAYVVYPLVEESEKLDLRAATEMAGQLGKEVFPEFVVGLMHGRLKPDEKEALMQRFQKGEVHLLVSTTVIEVGIDVPNATMMVVEHAERFGLSQLHQLRGRIGRGPHRSSCILLTQGARSREAFERLQIMRRSNDGFRIAEKDLEIRGPGEFVGTRQAGLPGFLFANLVRDRAWLELAQTEAENYLRRMLESGDKQEVLENLSAHWKKRYGLYEVG